MSDAPKFGMVRQNPTRNQIETMVPPAQQYPQTSMSQEPMMVKTPPPMYNQNHRQAQMMGYDDEDEYYDYMSEQEMSPSRKGFPRGKPSNKGKCAGRGYNMVPLIIYLIIIGLSFFGLLLSKQSMFGNLGLIVLQIIITLAIGAIIYYLTVRCQTVAALVILVIALILQLFMVVAAGIWFII